MSPAQEDYDIHHMELWDDGGLTDVDHGFCQCRRHHRLLHAGYRVEGDPHGELTFYRPDHTCIGSTYPAASRQLAGVYAQISPRSRAHARFWRAEPT